VPNHGGDKDEMVCILRITYYIFASGRNGRAKRLTI